MHPFGAFCCYAGFGTVVAWVAFMVMSPAPSELSTPSPAVANRTDADNEDSVASAPKSAVPVIVKFGAPWCGPCREIDVELQKLERSFGEKVKVVQINVDERPDLVSKCGVERIPHLFLFVDEKQVKEFQGFLTKTELVSWAGLQ